MALYPDPLQGGTPNLQGSGGPLQGGASPQQTLNTQQVQGVQAPTPSLQPSVAVPNQYVTPAPAPVPQPQQPAQVTPLNSLFDPYIGSRPSPANPGVLEYFNKQTNQGFSTPQQLFNFASG